MLKAEPDVSMRPIRRPLRVRYIASVVHASLFLAWWASYAVSGQGLAEGFTGLFFDILSIVDFPFSFVAFGIMFNGGRYATTAVIAWGLGGTLWWYLLGLGLDSLIRRRSQR